MCCSQHHLQAGAWQRTCRNAEGTDLLTGGCATPHQVCWRLQPEGLKDDRFQHGNVPASSKGGFRQWKASPWQRFLQVVPADRVTLSSQNTAQLLAATASIRPPGEKTYGAQQPILIRNFVRHLDGSVASSWPTDRLKLSCATLPSPAQPRLPPAQPAHTALSSAAMGCCPRRHQQLLHSVWLS